MTLAGEKKWRPTIADHIHPVIGKSRTVLVADRIHFQLRISRNGGQRRIVRNLQIAARRELIEAVILLELLIGIPVRRPDAAAGRFGIVRQILLQRGIAGRVGLEVRVGWIGARRPCNELLCLGVGGVDPAIGVQLDLETIGGFEIDQQPSGFEVAIAQFVVARIAFLPGTAKLAPYR
ncbi:hypothetical protein CAF53_03400 [Sphingobium sp. LB126]|nr:hypothetical protein CAF53_03400 [Sphingobium sp. LB126]